ncbi:hypothetical protein HRbin27_01144 [bacterium HR27]|nr:hypothetical protein HRbin27_01144 [bacterium HR27]
MQVERTSYPFACGPVVRGTHAGRDHGRGTRGCDLGALAARYGIGREPRFRFALAVRPSLLGAWGYRAGDPGALAVVDDGRAPDSAYHIRPARLAGQLPPSGRIGAACGRARPSLGWALRAGRGCGLVRARTRRVRLPVALVARTDGPHGGSPRSDPFALERGARVFRGAVLLVARCGTTPPSAPRERCPDRDRRAWRAAHAAHGGSLCGRMECHQRRSRRTSSQDVGFGGPLPGDRSRSGHDRAVMDGRAHHRT